MIVDSPDLGSKTGSRNQKEELYCTLSILLLLPRPWIKTGSRNQKQNSIAQASCFYFQFHFFVTRLGVVLVCEGQRLHLNYYPLSTSDPQLILIFVHRVCGITDFQHKRFRYITSHHSGISRLCFQFLLPVSASSLKLGNCSLNPIRTLLAPCPQHR